jgi:hypothetical protein
MTWRALSISPYWQARVAAYATRFPEVEGVQQFGKTLARERDVAVNLASGTLPSNAARLQVRAYTGPIFSST